MVQATTFKQLFSSSGEYAAYSECYQDLLTQANVSVFRAQSKRPFHRIGDGHVIQTIELIKMDVGCTREQLRKSLSELMMSQQQNVDTNELINIAIHAMAMVDCAAHESHGIEYSVGAHRPLSWQPDQKLSEYMMESLPRNSDVNGEQYASILRHRSALKAWKLVKRLGVKFRTTNDITEHLNYDSRHNVLYLFHHAAYLKIHLADWSGGDLQQISMRTSLEKSVHRCNTRCSHWAELSRNVGSDY